jgi:fructose-bisphosphate aldolase class 1
MNVRTKATTIFCVIAGVAAFGIGLSAEDSAKELAALQAVDQTWLKAYNAGDLDTLASLYG